MKKLFTLAVALFTIVTMFAQSQVTVTGTVTSKDDGQPVPGTNVHVKGTRQGTFTDDNG